jgi:AhpD family alkylhydroperoxidase
MTQATMQPRLDHQQASPRRASHVPTGAPTTGEWTLEPKPLHLIKTRASQINGCAYCIDMHTKDTRSRRNRTASVRIERLARSTLLHRERAGCV